MSSVPCPPILHLLIYWETWIQSCQSVYYTPGRGKIVPRNVINWSNVNNLTAHTKGLQRFWLHLCDHYRAVTQMYNNCAETHLGGGVMSPFVFPLSAIAGAHDPTVIGSVALRKGPWRFCPHPSDRCRALMLTCRKTPLWQRCECCIAIMFCPCLGRHGSINSTAWSSRDMCVNWNEL